MKKIVIILLGIFCLIPVVRAIEEKDDIATINEDTKIESEDNLKEKDTTTKNSSNTTDLAPNAGSAIMIEASTGEIIYEKNSHKEMPMASMTKMMTMLLIMEAIEDGSLSLEDEVTASEYAASMGGSQIFLEPGETMTVDEMLKGIAIGSGNDVAVIKKQSQVIRKEKTI